VRGGRKRRTKAADKSGGRVDGAGKADRTDEADKRRRTESGGRVNGAGKADRTDRTDGPGRRPHLSYPAAVRVRAGPAVGAGAVGPRRPEGRMSTQAGRSDGEALSKNDFGIPIAAPILGLEAFDQSRDTGLTGSKPSACTAATPSAPSLRSG
jgi:hypothetical protein